MPSLAEWIIFILMSVAPWLLAVWFIRYLLETSRERRRLRLEVSKWAHEMEGMRAERGAPPQLPNPPTD